MTIPNANLRAAFDPDGETIEASDPFALFDRWLALAERSEINDASAMALATVDAEGLPNVRMVLLKSGGPTGFVFYTNTGSQKGRELSANMKCAALLHWKSLRRQVRFRGPVFPVAGEEADAYFATRSRESRIGAWSSQQSRPLSSRKELEAAVARQATRFGTGDIPRPAYWSGFCVVPSHIEFWMDKPFRLHDRLIFDRVAPDAPWSLGKLYP